MLLLDFITRYNPRTNQSRQTTEVGKITLAPTDQAKDWSRDQEQDPDIQVACSNPTCFFWCKSHDHLSLYRRSDQKGEGVYLKFDKSDNRKYTK